MSADIIDPTSAAGIASDALAQTLQSTAQAAAAATAAAQSASQAASTQVAISALLAAIGVNHRWIGTSLQIELPDGSYGQAVDLLGPPGATGASPVLAIRNVTSGATASATVDNTNPLSPQVDLVLPQGGSGFSPVIAVAADGSRNVLQVVDWTGGNGAKPATGYIGPAGIVANKAAATDVTAIPGVQTVGTPAIGDIAIFSSATGITSGGPVTATGKSIISAAGVAAVKALLEIAVGDVAGAQAALGYTPENSANKGQASGYAGLDSSGKVPLAQMPSSITGGMAFAGTWNAATNTPTLASGTGTKGAVYKVTTAGTTTLDGISQWNAGDEAVFDGANWDRISGDGEIISIAGQTAPVITAAQLKTALAIASADITDATAVGKALLVAVNAAAGRTALGLAAVAASGAYADLSGRPTIPSVIPTAVTAKSAAYTVLGADVGTMFTLAGSPVLTLDSTCETTGFYFSVKKSDLTGQATITAPSGKTIDGLASIYVYQEDFTIYWDVTNNNFRTQGRRRGLITVQTAGGGGNVIEIDFTTGFNSDPEVRDMWFDAFAITLSAGDNMLGQIKRGSSFQTTNYASTATGSIGSSLNNGSSTAGYYIGTSGGSYNNYNLRIIIYKIQEAALGTFAEWMGLSVSSSNAGNCYGSGLQSGSGAVTGFRLIGANSTPFNVATANIVQKAYRI